MAAPQSDYIDDRHAGASRLCVDRDAFPPVLAAAAAGVANRGGDHPPREQFCTTSFTQSLWRGSGDLGLSAVRDNFRSYHAGATATEIRLLSTVLGPAVSPASISKLIDRFGSTAALASADADELAAIIGDIQEAAKLRSILQIAHEIGRQKKIDHPAIDNCEDLVRYLQGEMGSCRVETFRVLFLDTHNKVIANEVLWTGTVSEVQVYPREVMRRALELDSSAFIAAHNHPSEVVTPSKLDIGMTKKLLDAAAALDIAFHDHFIISANEYHSMRFHRSIDPWA
jgi:DNA repair protein RadC